jgi:FkbM family methyltransferase
VTPPAASRVDAVPRIAVCIANPAVRDPRLRAQIETADALSPGAEVDLFFTGDGAPACELLRRFRLHDSAALDRIHAARPYDAILRAPASPEPAAAWQATTKTHGEIAITPAAPLTGVADPLGPQPLLQREQARTYLDLSTTSFVVACPEIGGTSANVQMLVLAFADLYKACPHAWLFVARDPKTNKVPAEVIDQARAFSLHERIRAQVPAAPGTTPTAAASADDVYLAAADVVIAIAGAGRAVSPHVVMRACAAGKPVIVDDSEAWAWVPDDACVRVPAESFGLTLGQTLRALCHDPLRRAAMGNAGRAVYEREWTLAHLRTRLRAALELPADTESRVVPEKLVMREGPGIGFNRVCQFEDFCDPELVAEMHEVLSYKVRHFGPSFPRRVEHCKDWEVAMATRTLRQFGALRADASILGVAAGMEDTIFYLSKHVGEVMTVDRYVQSGVWQLNSPLWMLVTPEFGAPDGCNQDRIVVQHMDARRLRFPDDRFDGIFSSGSIEHFGGLMEVAHAAYEMGRVLKPGGILSLSTVMAIAGPPGRLGGVPGTCLLFQREHLLRYIVEASGLELVDALDTDATPATHAVHRSLEEVLTAVAQNSGAQGLKGLQEDYKYGAFPCLVLDWEGCSFDSVHLALRKPLTGWGTTNAWARPTPAVETSIREDYRRLIEDYGAWAPTSMTLFAPVDKPEIARNQMARINARVLRHHVVSLASDLDGLRSEVERHASQTPPPAVSANGAPVGFPETWVPIPLLTPNVPPYVLVADRTERRDIIVDGYLRGLGAAINYVEFAVISTFLQPGDAVIDAGAHLGSITLPLAASGCRVLAVEASSKNAALLRASVAYNGFRDVTVVHAAAAAAEGTLSFYADGAWGWVVPPGEAATEIVAAVRLDDLVDELGWTRVAAIKIDVEGGELAAIAGLERILSRPDAPIVYYESNTHTHQHAGTSAGQVVAALEAHGYRNYAVANGRLTRVRPDDQQREVVRDHLALKGPMPPLPLSLTVDEGRA